MKKQFNKKVASVAIATTIVLSSFTSASAATYTVKAGDSLSKIAREHNTTYTSIMNLNGLTTTNISIGQKLEINSKISSSSTAAKTIATANVVATAKKYLGTRYVFGGSTTSGFDCSGYVYYVLNRAGIKVNRLTAAGFYNKASKVATPKAGDLVFFSGTYKSGISHIGIYVGNGQMISATNSGVKITYVKSGYWARYFTGYGRI